MNFEIYGGFEIARDKKTRHGVFDKSFWKLVGERDGPTRCLRLLRVRFEER